MAAIDFQAVRNTHDLADVAGRYVELRKRGSELIGLCPFHEDMHPSFSIYRGSDGTNRYRCFACGAGSEGGDVLDFICAIDNCDVSEAAAKLNGNSLPPAAAPQRPKLPVDEIKCWEPIIPVPLNAPKYDPAKTYNPKRAKEVVYKPTRIDDYLDEDGRLICHVVRLEFDDGQKICPTITYCEGPDGVKRWCAKRMKPPYPLQGLAELAKRPTDHVLVVSGEKCREAAAQALPGFVAVTLLGGDQCVQQADIEPLLDRKVTLWPDADDSSYEAMKLLAKRCGHE